jgi:hypothetical protein
MCYHISNSRKVLRNALSPLIHKSSLAVKEAMEEIFIEAESSNGLINKNYGNLVIKACEILVNDQALNLQTKQSFACAAQQIANVRQAGHFYDTRKLLISNAHDALEAKDVEKFDESCDFLARIMRSAGNPLSPGRKTHELIEYFHDRYGEKAAIPLGHLVEKTELKDSSFQTRSSGMSR